MKATLNFSVDKDLCVGCGSCVSDCPYLVLGMEGELAAVVPGREAMCIKCLHCLTVCPTGAVSIAGYQAADCLALANTLPAPDQVEALIRGRRSVRRYKDENVEPQLIERLLQVAWQAPTGVNARGVLFTVVDDKANMAGLRKLVMDRLAELVQADQLPAHLQFYASFVKLWQEKGIDTLFRGAPHLVIASAPKNAPCPEQDCLIALSYLELFAKSLGLGTVWDGLAKIAITELMPELTARLAIPADHRLGYVMAFGKPAVHYPRTVPLRPAKINRIRLNH